VHRRWRGDRDGGRAPLSGDHASIERAALVAALKRVAEGDRRALQEVYRRTSAKLYGVALRIFPETDDAEDVLQEAFITIWQKADTFDPARASPITWLVTLTRNRAIDRLRSKGKRVMAPLDIAADVADDRPDAETCLIDAQADARVLACMETLPVGDAMLIRTAFFDGSTYADLAERATLPLGTVKSRIRRALLKLRECLA